jgi:hypothetical protein
MPDHTVTVTYDPDATPRVDVKPSLIQVRPGQTIHFKRAGKMAGRLRIKFTDREFFDTGKPDIDGTAAFHENDPDVRVKAITRRTEYVCELLDAGGRVIARSGENAGGAAEPVEGEPHGRDNKGGG